LTLIRKHLFTSLMQLVYLMKSAGFSLFVSKRKPQG
jgi:hypothetical protein